MNHKTLSKTRHDFVWKVKKKKEQKVKNNEKAIAKSGRLVKENREVDEGRKVSFWFAHCFLDVVVVFHRPKPGFLKENWTKGTKTIGIIL